MSESKRTMKDNLTYRATPNDDVSAFEISQDEILIGCVYNDLPIKESEANAAFICLAVNNHDKLVESLKSMLSVFGRDIDLKSYGENSVGYKTCKEAKELLELINSH